LVPPVSNVFYGVLGVNSNNAEAFKNNPLAQLSAQQAIAKSVNVGVEQVKITGADVTVKLRRLNVGNGTPQLASVGYEITVPIGSGLTVEQITKQEASMPSLLNAQLQQNTVAVTVVSISLPPPVLRRTSMTTSTTTTTITTVPVATCVSFVCPDLKRLREEPENVPCGAIGCDAVSCCVDATTLPPATAAPTAPPTTQVLPTLAPTTKATTTVAPTTQATTQPATTQKPATTTQKAATTTQKAATTTQKAATTTEKAATTTEKAAMQKASTTAEPVL